MDYLVMVENCNSNIDPRIKYKFLPPATVIKNFVDGEEDCNYEKYLLELLNHSNYFDYFWSCVLSSLENTLCPLLV